MNQKKRNNRLAALIIVAALCLAGCRSNSVTTATVRTDTHDEATVSLKHTIDSVIVRETVIIRERPDTVTVERERTVWRERIVHDTVREHTTDTIIKTVEVERVVNSPLPHSGRGKTGWTVALTLLAVIVIYMVIKHGLKIL